MPTVVRPLDFTALIDYFDGAPFDYLRLNVGGQALLLQRTPQRPPIVLTAPGVGTIVAPAPHGTLPLPGTRIRRGETLLFVHRFRSSLGLASPSDGTLITLDAAPGRFVEFGQALATVVPD